MLGAPLDVALTLPDDWTDRVLGFRPTGDTAPLVDLVQQIVRERGESAIGLRRVQDVALWLLRSSDGGDSPDSPWLGTVADRLVEASGGRWPVEVAAGERIPGLADKHLLNLAEDLDAIDSELLVLDRLVRGGARPIAEARGLSGFDWRVERQATRLPVEVKQKASRGTAGHRLQWFWKGISLLPRGAFIHRYRWHWHVDETARSDDARRMVDALWGNLGAIEDRLPDALDRARRPRAWDFEHIVPGGALRLRRAYFSSAPSVAIELTTNRKILVDVTANPDPLHLVCTGFDGGWIKPELRPQEAEDLTALLRRLNVGRQARRRGQDGLYVIAWWVPADWEPALQRDWLDGVCDELCGEGGPDYLAIWPIGLFEANRAPWGLSAAARRDLSWIAGG
jgi:hypothetical protein